MRKIRIGGHRKGAAIKWALVDDADFEYLNQWKWTIGTNNYAIRKTGDFYKGTAKTIWMHRLIMDTPKGMDTDHIDGNGLNNQRSNLRICTHQQNLMNQKLRSNNTTGVTGIYWQKLRKRWYAEIFCNNTWIYLGCFIKKKDAIKARKEGEQKFFKQFVHSGSIKV